MISVAASGIGAATARLFVEAGAALVLGWYPGDAHDVTPVLDSVTVLGGTAVAVEVDVSDGSQEDRLMRTAVDELGGLDVVVANAGIARQVPSAELSNDGFHGLIDVELIGCLPVLPGRDPDDAGAAPGAPDRDQLDPGRALRLAGSRPLHGRMAGIVGLVRTLALDVAADGITVNAVAPGVVLTPQSSEPINSLGPERIEAIADAVPVGRNGRPEDIAATFLYLASDEASFLTGQTLIVDGGVSLQRV